MLHEQWQDKLNEREAQYVPLITSCLGAVVLLSVIRDPIVMDFVPLSLYVVNGIALLSLGAMILVSLWSRVPAANSSFFIMLALAVFTLKTTAIVYIEAEPYPMIMAVLLFALCLCFLSHRYLLVTAFVIAMLWTIVAVMTLPVMQIVSTLLAMVIGCVMALFVLERRIQTLIQLFELKQRLVNLETILPMCASCKKTRDTEGRWQTIEEYIEEHDKKQVSHGVCPDCAQELYGDYLNK